MYGVADTFHMLGQLFDGRYLAVDRCFQFLADAVFGMQDNLAFEVLLEEFDYIFLYLSKYGIGIFHHTACHGTYHGFEHQQVFHFGYVGNEDMLVMQIVYLSLCTAVAVYDPHGFQRMEVL